MSHFLSGCPKFYGVIVLLSGYVVNSFFCITLMTFVRYLPMDLCDGIDFITTGTNLIRYPQWWFQDPNISLWQNQYYLDLKSVEKSWTYFGVGLKPPNFLYKINWDKWSCIVLLEIMVCGGLCLVLGISDIGFIEEKARVLCYISNGGAGLCHYHCIFETYA